MIRLTRKTRLPSLVDKADSVEIFKEIFFLIRLNLYDETLSGRIEDHGLHSCPLLFLELVDNSLDTYIDNRSLTIYTPSPALEKAFSISSIYCSLEQESIELIVGSSTSLSRLLGKNTELQDRLFPTGHKKVFYCFPNLG